MIVSPEVFYNISALLHIAMLVFVVLLIIGYVVVTVAKVRALRDLKSVKTEMEEMLAEMTQEEKPHHFSGFSRPEGVHVEEVDLSKAPAEVQQMAKELEAEMLAKGHKGRVRAIHVGSFAGGKFDGVAVDKPKPKRKRPAAKKVAKKVIKKNK